MNMVKKEYIAPAVEVVEMEVTHMLADSNLSYDPDESPDEELSNRRRNFWDEVGRGW